MYLDIRNNQKIILSSLPQVHTFIASFTLEEPIENGCTTGDFPHFDDIYHIAEGFVPFVQIQPEYNADTQVSEVQEILVADDSKSATQTWLVRDKSTDELAAEVSQQWGNIRAKRNTLLQQTDWTQLEDSNCAEKWKGYRQSLRDITLKYTSPDDVVFPERPKLGVA